MKQHQLEKKLKALGRLTDAQRKEVVCGLIGHSRIQSYCFGYYYCGRCQAQLGDSLASVYSGASEAVVINHNCQQCRDNFAKCTWKDKYLVQDPFKEDAA